jgi:hypothetical protein
MIFMDSTPKCEVKIKDSKPSVKKPNDGVTNEEQMSLLTGLFCDSNVKKK